MRRDPAGDVDGPNLYAYVRNRPLGAMDPSGLKLAVIGGGSASVNFFAEPTANNAELAEAVAERFRRNLSDAARRGVGDIKGFALEDETELRRFLQPCNVDEPLIFVGISAGAGSITADAPRFARMGRKSFIDVAFLVDPVSTRTGLAETGLLSLIDFVSDALGGPSVYPTLERPNQFREYHNVVQSSGGLRGALLDPRFPGTDTQVDVSRSSLPGLPTGTVTGHNDLITQPAVYDRFIQILNSKSWGP